MCDASVPNVPSQATSLSKIIAANLDGLISAKGLTNRQVADAVGSTEHQVWRWRRGKVTPNDENLAALAAALADGDLTSLLIPQAA